METNHESNAQMKTMTSRLAHIRKLLTQRAEAGSLCCLPDANGNIDTTAVKNPVTGYTLTGLNQILAKQFVKDNNAPTPECITFEQVQAAGTRLLAGVKGFSTITLDKNNELSSTRYFSPAQTVNPEKIAELVALNQEKRAQYKEARLERAAQLQTERGAGCADFYGVHTGDRSARPDIAEITCTSTTPAGYIGQYLAAVSSGAVFKATKEQASAFVENLEHTLYERNEKGYTNPFKLIKISNEANQICKETLKQEYERLQKKAAPSYSRRRDAQSLER